ncbi:hypothetical protein [Mesorhizobium sp. WSM4904]|uniref:hypothetical protein n=1 Tax=Mesorhizobium sp. WSM4904 TaxID=3038545 RepID=UPI00241869E3|nr:hypothetical protein [Mesorhizobium sp. WSM4904]WFP61626.1 hypothetical protein QAZ47_24575 [Mesorhizobium sp. WSM4904]
MNEHPASISASPVIISRSPTSISRPPTSISGLPTSISELIDSWQSIGAFAADVGCGYEAARQMRRRGRIAPQHWPHVVAASRRLGIAGVSYEWLAGRAAAMQGEAA